MPSLLTAAALLLLLSPAVASAGISCLQPNQDGTDWCAHFPGKTILSDVGGSDTWLRHKGKLYRLKLVSTKSIRKFHPPAVVAGDVERFEYAGSKIKMVVTKTVRETSCWSKGPSGEFVESESCCGSHYRLRLDIALPRKSESVEADWSDGG